MGYNTAFSMFGDKKLGQGAFGTVYSTKGSAVKVSHSKGLKALENEIQMLQQTSGIGVAPKLLGSGKGFAAIQKFDGDTLWNNLSKIKEDPVFADYIFRKIVESVGALHRKNIAHRDLHAGNIFITNDYQVKILDYGQALKKSGAAYYEAIFGSNSDPSQGALGLIAHSFENTKSYKTYNRILRNTVKIICKLVGADPTIVFTDYADIEGDEKKETLYFDELHKISLLPAGNEKNIISLLYNALDTALKINTKNPKKIRTIVPKTSIASKTSGIVSSINKKYRFPGTIPQASEGGVFSGPESGYPVILHGTEAVIPLNDVNLPPARFIQGQSAVWELEFESVLDHAVYFAGKSPFPKGAKQTEVLDWLQDTLGLTFKEIHDHRKKIIDKIRELTPSGWGAGDELTLIIPKIDSDFEREIYMESSQTSVYSPGEKFVDDQKEFLDQTLSNAEEALDETASDIMDMIDELLKQDQEKLNKFKEEENARLQQKLKEIREDSEEPEGLDDLLNDIKNEDDDEEDDSEPEGLDDLLNDVINEPSSEIPADALDDLPEGIREALAKHVNKKTGKQTIPTKEKSEKRTGITNTKIYNFLSKGIIEVQNKLNSIDSNIQHQNLLLQNIVDISFVTLQKVEEQDEVLAHKIDALTDAFVRQNSIAKDLYDKQQLGRSESGLERIRKSAGLETPFDTRKDSSKSGPGMISKIRKFFQTNVGKYLWKMIRGFLPKRLVNLLGKVNKIVTLPSRIASKISSKALTSIGNRFAPKIATAATNRAVAKGWEHIALPGVSRAVTQGADKPAAKAFSTGGDNILIKILKSKKVQEALVKKIGKEGAEKLSVKLAGKLIPGVSTVYGLGEGLARMAMGDIKGGFLSFGSAIPVAGWGFAAVDVLRDIDTPAYTKHIESNLGAITTGKGDEHIAAFFADALGVTDGDYERGGLTKPGTAMLHGTEAVIPKDNITPVDPIGGVLLAATSNYIQKAGPVANSIAPTIKQAISPLAKIYGVPNVSVSAPIGGNISSLSSAMKNVKTKLADEELTGIEKELLETSNADMFSERLYKMIDPSGKFLDVLEKFKIKLLNFRNPLLPPGTPGEVGAEPFVLLRGSQDDRQPGIDFTLKGTQNRAIFSGEVIEIGHQYNEQSQTGYGNYIVIRSTNPVDGSEVDMLYAHFPKGEIKVKQGDKVSVGQNLGRMATREEFNNPATRREVGSGTGAHTSLDFFQKGTRNTPHPKATQIGDYVLKELRKGPEGSIEKARQQAYQQQQAQRSQQPSGNYDVIIPLDHVKPGNENKIPDTRGGNTFKNASATGAAGRERQHQDSAASVVKSKLEAKGLRVRIITPEEFGNYQDYDNFITSQASKGVRVVPLHFDAAVGQGGTGFLTRIGAGDRADASLASPIQRRLAMFQKSNPKLGNLGPTDTQSNATINRAGLSPATLVEMGSMVAWEKEHGKNFTASSKFNELATHISEGIYQGGEFNKNISPPSSNPRFESIQGSDKDSDTKFLIVNQPTAPVMNGTVSAVFREEMPGRWISESELPSSTRQLYIQRLGRN